MKLSFWFGSSISSSAEAETPPRLTPSLSISSIKMRGFDTAVVWNPSTKTTGTDEDGEQEGKQQKTLKTWAEKRGRFRSSRSEGNTRAKPMTSDVGA